MVWKMPARTINTRARLFIASPGFEIYGLEPFTAEGLPPAGEPIFTENLTYHIREGKHDITLEDWNFFMDFADRSLRP